MVPTRILRLHRDIYLPVQLASRAAGVPVEKVIEVAFRYFSTLDLEEKITRMHRWRMGPGYSTTRAKMVTGEVSRPYFGKGAIGTVIHQPYWYQKACAWVGYHARLILQRLFRRGDST